MAKQRKKTLTSYQAEVREPAIRRYSSADYWLKLKLTAQAAGRELVEKSLWLHYASKRPETPLWVKTVIYSALAYFILPTDVIPDLIPVTGYIDDMAAITVTVSTINNYIDEDVKQRAREKLDDWFT